MRSAFVPTSANDVTLAKKLARKTNPINFTIKLLRRNRMKAKTATMIDRMVCAIAKSK
jgi:hypothetical protein